MTMLFLNDWQSTIQEDLSQTETAVTIEAAKYAELATISGDDYYPALLWNGSSYELVHITAKNGSNEITIEREQEGDSAIVCRTGDSISIINSAGVYEGLNQKESPVQMNRNSINADLTIPENYNALSVGPLTVGPDVAVTIETDSVWEVL